MRQQQRAGIATCRGGEIAADPALVGAVTPRGFVRDDVTESTVGQITGMQLGEQSKPCRVEQAIDDLECVEQTETRIIIQRADIDACQLRQPGQHSHSLTGRGEHRLPEPVDPYRTATTGQAIPIRGCLVPIPSRTHVRSLPHPCDSHPRNPPGTGPLLTHRPLLVDASERPAQRMRCSFRSGNCQLLKRGSRSGQYAFTRTESVGKLESGWPLSNSWPPSPQS